MIDSLLCLHPDSSSFGQYSFPSAHKMNVTQDATSLQATIGLVVLVLNFFLTVPTIKGLSRRSRSKRATQTLESVHEYYEDEDGTATEQTQKQHSTTIQIYAALASTIVGLAISVTASVLSSIQPSRNLLREHLFTVGSWVGCLT